jgi:hypothetical protein
MKISPFPVLTLVLLLAGPTAFCQATRTWVSGVGDDSNPASRTAPAVTFAGAIVKTATGGEIDNLDTGDYAPVTITQSVTIDGGPGVAGIQVNGSPAIIISASGPIDVTLRNLSLDGEDGGGTVAIQVLSPVVLHIENCRIFGFSGHGVDFEPSASSALYIKNSHIFSNGGDGVYLKPGGASSISIINSSIDSNGVGVHGDASTVTAVQGCTSVGNTGAGFETATGGAMNITNSISCLNGVGISSAGVISLANDTAISNLGKGLDHTKTGVIQSFHDNAVAENPGGQGAPSTDLPLR